MTETPQTSPLRAQSISEEKAWFGPASVRDAIRGYCGRPTLRTSSANRGSERRGSSWK